MKPVLNFIKATITGGLLFLIPLVIIIVFIGKAFQILRPLLERTAIWARVDTIIGVTFLTVLTALLLCLICFLAGLLIRLDRVRSVGKTFEEVILRFLPGFEYLKLRAGDESGGTSRSNWKSVILQDGEGWVIAFLVETHANGYTTVFLPESPRGDSGNTRIVQTASIRFYPLPRREVISLLRHYGAGASRFITPEGPSKVESATI